MKEEHTTIESSSLQKILGEYEARIEYSTDPEWMSKNEVQTAVFYDNTVKGVRSQVSDFLSINCPAYFSNIGDRLAAAGAVFVAKTGRHFRFCPLTNRRNSGMDGGFTAKTWTAHREPASHLVTS